jgi:nicotinamidase-related amidase
MTNIPRLNQNNIFFVFIDLQNKLLSAISNGDSIIKRNQLLLEAANLLGLPYMLTSQYRKGLGEIVPQLSEKNRGEILDKMTFSCAADEFISREMARVDRPIAIVSGVETHICVLQTSLDLLDKGKQVAIVADAVGARNPIDHELGLKRMESAGALPVTAEMLIYEVLGRSDSPQFKQILPLIKNL